MVAARSLPDPVRWATTGVDSRISVVMTLNDRVVDRRLQRHLAVPHDGTAHARRPCAYGFVFGRLAVLDGFAVLVMILFAGQEIMQRQDRRLSGWWSFGLGTGCMMMASVMVTAFALLTALRPNPWYDPRYAIPLLGMILGNCMTGIALGLNTLTTNLMLRRASVEAQLCSAPQDGRRPRL